MKIAIVAFFTTILGCIGIILPFSLCIRLMFGVVFSIISCCFIAFWYGQYTKKGIIKILLIALGMSCFLGTMNQVFNEFVDVKNKNTVPVLLSTVLSTLVIGMGIKYWGKEQKENFYQVNLYRDQYVMEVIALLDTGNGLVEPVSQKVVSLVAEEILNKLHVQKEKIKAIPYCAVGTEKGILYGFEIDKLIIFTEERKVEVDKPIIASGKIEFGKNKQYKMILHPMLLK